MKEQLNFFEYCKGEKEYANLYPEHLIEGSYSFREQNKIVAKKAAKLGWNIGETYEMKFNTNERDLRQENGSGLLQWTGLIELGDIQ